MPCPPSCLSGEWSPGSQRSDEGLIVTGRECDRPDARASTRGMRESTRCGAKTRAGSACKAPAVQGKKRCRMHGGAPGSGAPLRNQNALKHGRYTRAMLEFRREMAQLMREARATLGEIS